jgi:hypothetical protein
LTTSPTRFHDQTIAVTRCGRICFKGRKVNLSHVFAGQNVGLTQVGERIWLVTFMLYDLGYSMMRRAGSNRLKIRSARKCYLCARNELLPMCPEWTWMRWLTSLDNFRNWLIRCPDLL